MRKSWAAAIVSCVVTTFFLAGCGGGSDDSSGNANVRLINATLTHPTLTLLANSKSVIAATPADTVSDYSDVSSGSPTLQLNDGTSGAVLTSIAPSLSDGSHYTLLAYEIAGTVRTTVFSDGLSTPSSGTTLNVFNAAIEGGAIDVYIGVPGSALSSPSVTLGASTTVQSVSNLSVAQGTYQIVVTGSGNPNDIRLSVPSVTFGNQQVATLILTPSSGGTLVNGAVVVQQGAYTAAHNTNARVRLAASVSGGAVVTAASGGVIIANSVTSPNVSPYVLVPAATAFNITVNGAAVASPATLPAEGSDITLLVYGPPGAAVANAIVDDNRLPSLASSLKIRLVNGLTGTVTPLTMAVNFAVVASNIAPGAASSYLVIPASDNTQLEVTSPSSQTPLPGIGGTNLPLLGASVYTQFVLGDASAPTGILRKDR